MISALRIPFFAVAAFLFVSFTPAIAAPVDDASKYIEGVGNSAVETLSNKALSKDKKRAKIEKLFRDNVDTAWIGKFVLGRFWRTATDAQKKAYMKEYETFLVENYATRFTDYTGGSFKISDAKDSGDGEYVVSMQIQSGDSSAEPVLVDYKVRKGGKNGYAIFDIIVEGVSMITTQRSEFSSVVSNKGLDYLVSQLANKTEAAKLVTDKSAK